MSVNTSSSLNSLKLCPDWVLTEKCSQYNHRKLYWVTPDYSLCDLMKSLQKILHIDDATYVRKHVFGRAVYLQWGTLQRVSEAADLKWSTVELKPALWAKRITAEHHPVSMARWKPFLTLRRTVSVLYALGTDWPYCMFSDFTLTYHQLSTVNSCASAASVAEHVNIHRRLFGKVLGLQLKMPSVCWLQIPDDSLHSEQSGVL